MEKCIGPSFKKVKSEIYKKDKNGFYVYAKPALTDPATVSQYICRYPGRPVIGLSRISSYDGESVTFHYNRHEDNVYVEKKLPVIDFIKLLIQHIPEKHFKMTRYYGLYARNREPDESLNKLIPKSRHKILLAFNTWRNRIASCFGYDPVQCPNCNRQMELIDLYYKHTRVSLEDLYERAMAKMKHHAGGKAA